MATTVKLPTAVGAKPTVNKTTGAITGGYVKTIPATAKPPAAVGSKPIVNRNTGAISGGYVKSVPATANATMVKPTGIVSKPSSNLAKASATPTKGKLTTAPSKTSKSATFDPAAYYKQQQDQVNSVYDQIQKARTDAYNAQKDQAIGDINFQKEKVAPQYQGLRNQTDVTNLQNAKKLQEMMASRGLGTSGENVTATVNQNNARQNSLNDLNLQEQQTLNDYEHQISNLNDPAELNAMLADISSQRAQALMDAGNRADQVGYQRSRDSISDKRYTDETAYNHGRDKTNDNWRQKEFDYSKSMDNRNYNYQVGRDKVTDNQWNKQYTYNKNVDTRNYNYQVGRDKVSDGQWNKQFTYQSGRDKVADKQWNDQFSYQKSRDSTSDNQWQKQFDYNKSVDDREWNQMSPAEKARMALQYQYSKKSSGGGGGGGRSRRSTRSYVPSRTSSSVTSYAQSSKPQTALDRYYSTPAVSAMESAKARNAQYARLIGDPTPPAQSKYLSAWDKMKMLGM